MDRKKQDSNLELNEVREKLNSISSSFCLAKWTQVTIHLQSGNNHSCHHPQMHSISAKEVKYNPSALHNTFYKKEQRRKMLSGERPRECDYCWNIEDLGPQHFSDRTLKSSNNWSWPYFEKISSMSPNADYTPQYVEISFSNTCNFACSYCSGNFSSRWQLDIQKNGKYPTLAGETTSKIVEEESNPFVAAFWKWWPELKRELKVFRITGGEPLLSVNTGKVVDCLMREPEPELTFAINSNLGVPQNIVKDFAAKANVLLREKKVAEIQLYTSIDTWGKQAEYIRHGLNLEIFKSNIDYLLNEVPRLTLGFMVTFNNLSLISFIELLKYVIELRKKFGKDRHIALDVSYLRHPPHQSIQILTPSYLKYMEEILSFMKNHSKSLGEWGFTSYEIGKVERSFEWMKLNLDDCYLKGKRADFYRFFSAHDQRRNTCFISTFPEMIEFWELCKTNSEELCSQ